LYVANNNSLKALWVADQSDIVDLMLESLWW